MNYSIIVITAIIVICVGRCIYLYRQAVKKPKFIPLPEHYAHVLPTGAINGDSACPYTIQASDTTYNMLYLPGSAKLGAYSTGIACALQQKQDFHNIVGFSSGALATLFLYAHDTHTLKQFLNNIDTSKVLTNKPALFSLVFGYSIMDNALLQSYLTDFITDDFIDTLAHRYTLGYRAYVISHNIDTGNSVFWDIGAIASQDLSYVQRQQHLIRAVVASTALPMIFNPISIPVTIDNTTYAQTHMDGVISAHTVFYNWMLPENLCDFDEKTITIAQSKTYTDIAPVSPTPWKTAFIGIKALENTYYSTFIASLHTTQSFAHTHNMCVRINHIAKDTILTPKSMDFSNHTMTTYFNAGIQETEQDKIVWHPLHPIRKNI